jgi:hypothetical protein
VVVGVVVGVVVVVDGGAVVVDGTPRTSCGEELDSRLSTRLDMSLVVVRASVTTWFPLMAEVTSTAAHWPVLRAPLRAMTPPTAGALA